MVHLTVDTEKDSANTIRRVITILEEELGKKDDGMMSDYSSTPSYSAPSNPIESRKTELNNPFAMFNDDTSSTPEPEPTANAFAMFDEPTTVSSSPMDSMESQFETPSEEPSSVQMYDEHTTDKIILNAPPKKESSDFEKSSRFADQVELNKPKRKPSSTGFFNDLDEY